MPNGHHSIVISHDVDVRASAELVYDMVADVTRMGEWSPECVDTRWVSGEHGRVGGQFVGSNYERNEATGQEWRWEMTCEVVVADRPRAFGWTVLTEAWDHDTSVWTFTITPTATGCTLRQDFRMKRPPRGWQPILDRHELSRQIELVAARRARLDRGMQATLSRIAEAAARGDVPGSAGPT